MGPEGPSFHGVGEGCLPKNTHESKKGKSGEVTLEASWDQPRTHSALSPLASRSFGALVLDIVGPSMGRHSAEDSGTRKSKRRPGTSEVQSGGEANAWDSIPLCDTRDHCLFFEGGQSDGWPRGSSPSLPLTFPVSASLLSSPLASLGEKPDE